MNQFTFHRPGVNNDENLEIYTPSTQEQFKDQFSEILEQEHYQKGRIKRDMTIIDCGANVGLASIYFKDWAKVIYALEPNSQNFSALVMNTKQFKNIKPFHTGLAARASIESLRSNDGNLIGESLFGNGEITEQVKMYSLEDFMNENKINHVDLLKMDAEGAEYIVFPSMSFERVAHKIDYIIGEAHYFNTLRPEYVPLILADVGYDMQFLPIVNMYTVFDWLEERERHYRIEERTLFFAKRKELPWPS